MKFSTVISPHLEPANSVSKVMQKVLIALIPGIATMYWYFGIGILINIGIAIICAIMAEAFILWLRDKPVLAALQDLSAVVTAVLLAISLPVIAPWWITVIGTLFAIVIAKHLYGGLGYNPFNPAMAGYVLLLVSFPLQMTSWLPPLALQPSPLSSLEVLNLIFFETLPNNMQFDAITMATPLDTIKTQLGLGHTIDSIRSQSIFGSVAGKGWERVAFAYLLGGFWLLQQRVISWQIPMGLILGLGLTATLFFLIDDNQFASPGFHLVAGATVLGAFFIATDPVTAATSTKGRMVYGVLIGVLTYVIRTWGGYPDAVAFSVMLANLAAPTIDHFTRPRVFGYQS